MDLLQKNKTFIVILTYLIGGGFYFCSVFCFLSPQFWLFFVVTGGHFFFFLRFLSFGVSPLFFQGWMGIKVYCFKLVPLHVVAPSKGGKNYFYFSLCGSFYSPRDFLEHDFLLRGGLLFLYSLFFNIF